MHFLEPNVSAFSLAKQFRDFVEDDWTGAHFQVTDESGATVDAVEPGDLFGFFADWVMEPRARVISQTAGSHAMVVLTWVVISAWFSQRPEDFAAIRDRITTPLELSPDATGLPRPLDEASWNAHVFAKMHGGV